MGDDNILFIYFLSICLLHYHTFYIYIFHYLFFQFIPIVTVVILTFSVIDCLSAYVVYNTVSYL